MTTTLMPALLRILRDRAERRRWHEVHRFAERHGPGNLPPIIREVRGPEPHPEPVPAPRDAEDDVDPVPEVAAR